MKRRFEYLLVSLLIFAFVNAALLQRDWKMAIVCALMSAPLCLLLRRSVLFSRRATLP